MTRRQKPFRDSALDNKPPPYPVHDFPQAWYGNVLCNRCGKTIEEVEMTQAPCVTDAAIKLGRVFARLQRQRTV